MRRIKRLQQKVDQLQKQLNVFDRAIWKLENPPKFSFGDKVRWVDGDTTHDGRVVGKPSVDYLYNDFFSEEEVWVYNILRDNDILKIHEALLTLIVDNDEPGIANSPTR